MNAPRPAFVYDGDCSFCTSCARFIEARIPTRAQIVAWQFTDLRALGLTAGQCQEAVRWVDADGQAAGPEAIARMLRDAGRAWGVAGDVLAARQLRWLAWWAYRWVADHRHRMPGGTAACAVPPGPRASRNS